MSMARHLFAGNVGLRLAGSMSTARAAHRAVALPDGRILVAGGWATSDKIDMNSAEIYDPTTGTFSPAAAMGQARDTFTLTLMGDGRVLAAGGGIDAVTAASAEVYEP
jgi:hypothetical protein